MTRLRHSIFKILSGNVIFALGQWAIVIMIAKIGGAEAVGVYALANAITAPAFAFATLGLRASLATDAQSHHSLISYGRLAAIASLMALIVCIVLSFSLDFSSVLVGAVIGLATARFAENGSLLVYGLLQKHEQMHLIGRSMALRGIFSFAALISILIIAPQRVDIGIIGIGLAWLAVFLAYDLVRATPTARIQRQADAEGPSPADDRITPLFKVVLPLGALALITNLILNVPRYLIETQIGTAELGYYAAIMQIAAAGVLVVNSILQTVVPRMSQYFLVDHRAYLKLLMKALAMAVTIGLLGLAVAVLFGRDILRLLYTEEFAANADTLTVAMIWSALLYISVTLGTSLTAMRSFTAQFFISCCTFTATLIGAWLLIPKFGILGGALGLVLGVLVKIALQLVALSRRIVLNPK